MIDREKVIKGLECCMSEKICSSKCPYKGQCDDGGYYYSKAIEDAISLLKAQEAVEPSWRQGIPFCGKCGRQFGRGFNYCPDCGTAVRWE